MVLQARDGTECDMAQETIKEFEKTNCLEIYGETHPSSTAREADMNSNTYRPSTSDLTEMGLFCIEPEITSSLQDMNNEDLRSFAELHEDPVNDVQIELYVFTCFLLFKRTLSTEHLQQAIQRMEGWVAVTSPDDPNRGRRFQVFDMMSARMCEHTYISQELLPSLMEERYVKFYANYFQ